ncbi:MAG: hypothetical protein HY951_15470 [Bacteroidia bacterium]|nr:hypothetical protein [Bacteroidia bacterium]
MKKLNLIILICICFALSCKKDTPVENTVNNNCIDNSLSAYYLDFWKSEFLNRDTMTEEYFNSHISEIKTSAFCWNSAITFRVAYKITIDWAVIDNYDEFIVKLYSSESAYQYLNIPRDTFFNVNQLMFILEHKVFNSAIGPVKSLNNLLQNNYNNAKLAFQDSANSSYILPTRLSYDVPGIQPSKNGYPYFIGFGTINQSANQCITGYYNLSTGEFDARETPCLN